jgi:hypothetical protein
VTSNEYVFLPIEQLQPLRVKRLYGELAFALSRTDGTMLRGWGGRAASRLFHLGARRVGGLAQLISGLARFGGKEVGGFYQALRGSRFGAHAGQRTAAVIDGAIAVGSESRRFLTGIGRALLRDPKGMAPKVLGAFLGFNTGSGGLDGNGGIPDLDLLAGIGYHRSPLTHTIIAGIVAEGMLLAIVDLAAEIHSRLPHDHDPLWDSLARIGRPFMESASISLSAGIAWHLLVDAGIQPAPYHDLPFSMPIEAHQAVFAANGAAEGVDAARRAERTQRGPILLEPNEKQQRTIGERVVDGVTKTARRTGAGVMQKTGAMAQSIADRARGTR